MRRFLTFTAIAILCLATSGVADVNHQLWWQGSFNHQGMIDFHADKLPTMEVSPDIDTTLPETSYNLDEYNTGDPAYTANIWGWVTIPVSGDYTWHIAADDQAALYIADSMDDIIANYGGTVVDNPTLVAAVDGWTGFNDWNGANGNRTGLGKQNSDTYTYTAGQTLALYATHSEGTGGDHLHVAWTPPGGNAPDSADLSANVTNIAPSPTSASGASPKSGSTDLPYYEETLSWFPGVFANTHNVYLSTNFADVNDRSAAALVADGISDTSLDISTELETTYYWAVDEVNGAPDFTVYPGKVWSFTTEPVSLPITGVSASASSEFNATSTAANLVNGSGMSDGLHGNDAATMWLSAAGDSPAWVQFDLGDSYVLHSMMVWNQNQLIESLLGFGAKDVVVETSADGENWNAVEGATLINQGPGAADYAANTTIDMGGALASHVRITVNSGYGFIGQVGLSEVQFTSIPAFPREFSPANGAVADGLDLALSWRAGRFAAEHQVLLSTNRADIEDGSAVVATTTDKNYTLSGLEYGNLYFNQVIDVADDGSTFAGPINFFYTTSTGTIEDFESYKDQEGLEIWASWVDGFDDPANGSLVGAGSSGNEAETGSSYEGGQSLPLAYDTTSAAMAEATRTFEPSLDLTAGSPANVGIYFQGSPQAFGEDADGNITLSAAGADIWNTADEFRFAYKSLSGDGSITARVHSHTVVHNWSKIGVMIRESNQPESAMYFLPITGVNGVRPQGRTATFVSAENQPGGLDGVQETIARDQAVWLRIDRKGNDFSGFYSTEETVTTWSPMPGNPWTIPMAPNTLIGLAATSHSVGNTVVAQISDVSTTGNVTGAYTVEEIGGVHPSSDAAGVYMTVTDSAGKSLKVSHPDAAATNLTSWTLLNIPYSDLGGVNLSSISSVSFGVEGAGATGTVLADFLHVSSGNPSAELVNTQLGTIGLSADDVVAMIEAESGAITGPFQTLSSTAASGGRYIAVPNGVGSSTGNPVAADDGWAVYTLDIPADGDYMIVLRGWNETAGSGSDDSFWVNIPGMVTNDEAQHESGWLRSNGVLHGPAGVMVWDLVRDDQQGNTDPVVFTMTAGQHELQISRREDGSGLDAIAIVRVN